MRVRVFHRYVHAVDVEGETLDECLRRADEIEDAMPLGEWHDDLEYEDADWVVVPVREG